MVEEPDEMDRDFEALLQGEEQAQLMAQAMESVLHLARPVAAYYRALVAMDVPVAVAAQLALNYQRALLVAAASQHQKSVPSV